MNGVKKNVLAVVAVLILMPVGKSIAATTDDEKAIRALNDVFTEGFVKKDAKLRASIWLEEGTLVPPTGGFFQGRDAIEGDFQKEIASVTDSSSMTFSNYRFRFITRDCALVDTEVLIRNVKSPDGKLVPVLNVSIVFTAVRRGTKWFVQDERAHFVPPPAT